MVDEVQHAPERPREEPRSGWTTLTDPAGRTWNEVETQISPERARELVLAGAALAWDDCGSRGYGAPIECLSREEAVGLAAGGAPVLRVNKRHSAELSAWVSGDGTWLVLASMSAGWGRRLA